MSTARSISKFNDPAEKGATGAVFFFRLLQKTKLVALMEYVTWNVITKTYSKFLLLKLDPNI